MTENYSKNQVIISVGYRVKSIQGTRFRQWVTQRLKEYIIKGFSIDDEKLKGSGGGNYWKELLDRIRDIRSSEKVLYRQVLDLYATATDYDPKSKESIQFFKIIQNKLYFAAHGHTTAETISHSHAKEKAKQEYKTYKAKTLSGVEKDYLEAIKVVAKKVKPKAKK